MTPRPQQGTSLLVTMQLMATDEGLYMARVAFKDPSAGGRVTVSHDSLPLWQPVDVREQFAYGVGAYCIDAIEWTVS